MNKLYVLFAKNKRWWAILSDIIRLVERVDYSHAAIMLHNTATNQSTIYESRFPRGRSIDLIDWLKEYEIKEVFLIDDNFDVTSEKYYDLISMVRKPYSILQLLLIGLGIICLPFGRISAHAKINGNRAKVCTELVATFLSRAYGVRLKKSPDMMGLRDTLILVDEYIESKKRI
jgi:hypothetical protein